MSAPPVRRPSAAQLCQRGEPLRITPGSDVSGRDYHGHIRRHPGHTQAGSRPYFSEAAAVDLLWPLLLGLAGRP